ncbi:MAG: hypothetical protein JO217_14555 [Acidobacteriaceae bacterium]|nr:hypothetical protein [Acidobacteriaceae bacterium]
MEPKLEILKLLRALIELITAVIQQGLHQKFFDLLKRSTRLGGLAARSRRGRDIRAGMLLPHPEFVGLRRVKFVILRGVALSFWAGGTVLGGAIAYLAAANHVNVHEICGPMATVLGCLTLAYVLQEAADDLKYTAP